MGSFTPPPTTQLSPGDRLDRYELLCVLAQGGMGTVWLSRMTGKLGFERLVALKTILPTYSSDRQFCDMFLDEARIAAQIDQENVARILEIGEDRGLLYYAMELIDGESVRKLYRDVRAAGHAFPMGVALRIVADASAGLHATHELRSDDGTPLEVVHRDVSPQNLLVSIRGTTKLIDFGVAKANARRSEETAAGTLKGKIEYMAPEQARGEPLDRRADVYALGAVLFELLAGRPVRDTDDGKQLVALHALMTGVPYAPLPPEVPEIVRGIVDRSLARDPRARFPTADALRQAIEQALLVTGLVATNEEVGNVLAHFSRERTAKRKDAIERAVRAATDGRLNAATIMAPLSARALPSLVPVAAASSTSASSTSPSLAGLLPPDGPPTGPSMHTVGAASITAHPVAAPMAGSSVAKVFAGVLVLALVAVLGVVAGVFVTRRGERPPVVVVAAASATTLSDPLPPAVVIDPPAASGVSDAAPAADARVPRGRDAGVALKRPPTPGAKASGKGKQGDGDEYGF